MSIEFIAKVDGALNLVDVIRNRLASSPEYEVLAASQGNCLRARLAKHAARTEWPEDFTLMLEAHRVYLAFHRSTADERATLLALLEDVFRCEGRDMHFEEA